MKSKAVYVLVVLSAVLAVVTSLYRCSGVLSTTEASGLPENFNALGRQEQVLVCASCHPKQYENEMAGPHANAYDKLMLHINETQVTTYPHAFYGNFINGLDDQVCASCHATGDLFQDYFSAPDNGSPKHWKEENHFPLPTGRSDTSSFRMGVDCLTCHYDGKRVMAAGNFVASDTLNPLLSCLPVASTVLSSDLGCMPCHPDNRVNDNELYYTGLEPGKNCISCHQEKDGSGKGTHYYYWKYDSEQRTKANPLLSFYAPASISIENNNVLVRWKNENLPHAIGQCPEMVVKITVEDKNQTSLAGADLRFNRRDYYGAKMLQMFGGNTLPGVSGFMPVLYKTDTMIVLPIPARKVEDAVVVTVNGISKTQYWHHDSTGVVRYSKQTQLR